MNAPDSPALARIRIVLSRPSHPGNIGAAARAMKTMGLAHLHLVAPDAEFPSAEAESRASGAIDVLAGAQVHATLDEALAGCQLAVAITARRRDLSPPFVWARDAAVQCVRETQHGDVALVFGHEKSGLSNEEVMRCQLTAGIPVNPDYGSLNLGAAVQVLCYELRLAAQTPAPVDTAFGEHATLDELERFYAQLEEAMIASEFLDPARPGRLMLRLRRLFGRARVEKEEINILRGMIAMMTNRRRG